MVYVLSINNEPLMPCSNVIARLLLKQGKAKVKYREPFTIKLTYETTTYTQPLTLGVDTGSQTFATAVTNGKGNILYTSEVVLREDKNHSIKKKMDQRRMYRRNRRNRKTRYRKARFNNRKNSKRKNRFSPTMTSKLHSHQKEIEFIKSILPIAKLIFETGTFDPHLMKNPSLANLKVKPWGYQQGPNYGFENMKARILARDNHTCQICKKKPKNERLEVHHIIFRSQGGSDEENNLVTVCHSCHVELHKGLIHPNFEGSLKNALKYATQMNSIRVQLLKLYPDAIETFGYVTKANRLNLGLPKEHYVDAAVIATAGNQVKFACNLMIKRCIPKGDFQRTKGIRSEKIIPKGKIDGFKKYDKVRYFGNEYFVKGRMTTGYIQLMNIYGEKISFNHMPKGFKTPKTKNCQRISARKTWITTTEPLIKNIA